MIDRVRHVLIVGTEKSVFVTRTVAPLRSLGMQVEIMDPYTAETSTKRGIITKSGNLLRRIWRTAFSLHNYRSDSTVIVMYLSVNMFWLVPLLKLRFRRVTGLAFGSDILRRVRRWDSLFVFGLNKFDALAATNINVMNTMVVEMPKLADKQKYIIRFGLPVFDELDALKQAGVSMRQAKQRLGFNPDKKLIALGYSGSEGQRQVELINSIALRSQDFRGYEFIVPVQYGDQGTIQAVRKACDLHNSCQANVHFEAFDVFQEPHEAALLRLATDVLINHSISDAFSGTVQEVVYAGNMVLAGEHLPYAEMPGHDTAIKNYTDLSAGLDMLISPEIENWCSKAQTAILENQAALKVVSSWSAVLPAWQELISPSGQE